jgi:hypothetical protein
MLNTQQYNAYKQIDNKNRLGIKQKPARMPKEQAQELSQKLKMATMAASIIAFGLFGGLIAPEIQRSAATQTQSSSATGSQSTDGNTQIPSSDSQSGGFFGQQQNGGYNFGNSGSSTTSGAGTHVS